MNKQKLSAVCGLGALTLIAGFGLGARPASALPTALSVTRLASPVLDHDGNSGWGGWQDRQDRQIDRRDQDNQRRDRENRERDRENRRRDEENRRRDAGKSAHRSGKPATGTVTTIGTANNHDRNGHQGTGMTRTAIATTTANAV